MASMPEGHHTINPYLTCQNAASAIGFYKTVFGAEELERIVENDGRIGHATLQIGNSRLMLSDEHLEINVPSPKTLGGTPVGIIIYVEDADVTASRAVEAGMKVIRPVATQGNGLRLGIFECPYGHRWFVSSFI